MLTKMKNQWIVVRNDSLTAVVTTRQLLKALITSRNHNLTGSIPLVIDKNIFIIAVDDLIKLIDN